MGKVVPLFSKPSDGSEKPEEPTPQASPQSVDEELADRLLVDYQYFRDNKDGL